ncbi:MAG TPA: Asp-tRNA(Asn)/Glu-tRNA(Gln) amidotransferase subunit GatC [Candidatus Paceibacterota bacterium]|nr:Asp-tRNA(Asn)/Glu-tRNA(Gln) amidotransferase subunit GatC [Candidatus Paceibacterota bacterium]
MASPEEVKRLAALARVRVPEEKISAFAAEFDAILAYIGKLEELSLAHETPKSGAVRNVLREDGEPHASGAFTEKLVQQFPDSEGDYLSVKQILSHD